MALTKKPFCMIFGLHNLGFLFTVWGFVNFLVGILIEGKILHVYGSLLNQQMTHKNQVVFNAVLGSVVYVRTYECVVQTFLCVVSLVGSHS